MAAITLVEQAKQTQNPLAAGVLEQFARTSPVLERVPIQNISGNAYSYDLEAELPGVGFRGVNEAYADQAVGVINPQTEQLKIAGGDSDVDKFLVRTQAGNAASLRGTRLNMKTKALSLNLTKKFFKGDTTTEPREFDGLERRITGSQLIKAGTTVGGDALTLAVLDEAIDAVDGADVLFMNKWMKRKINTLVRAAGQATEVVSDSFGRPLVAYAGVPIAPIEEDEAGNLILDWDENDTTGAGASCSSIYVVKFGADEYTSMLQNGGVDVADLGEIDDKPVFRVRIEWYVTLALFSGKAVSRVYGIKKV